MRPNDLAHAIATDILAGFDRHYRLFRHCAQEAKHFFESGRWNDIQQLAKRRISYFDQRVHETTVQLRRDYPHDTNTENVDENLWERTKRIYVTFLVDHKQPELAETFFNSVITRILHRDYFHNRFLFVRPAVSTEYVDAEPQAFRSYYPSSEGLRKSITRFIRDFALNAPFQDLERDIRRLIRYARTSVPRPLHLDPDCQIQVLSSLFFRNKGAYIIGKWINGNQPTAFAIPLLMDKNQSIFIDTVLFGTQAIATLFSFTRAYFFVDMAVPAAYVQFLRTLVPHKPKAEIYTMLGLHKQGKTLFYRDFLHHLQHSHDHFIAAPGIRGLVMAVFTLPSYPYVFKMIKDRIAPSKNIDREGVMQKYQLVKSHDRVGRLADTWEYSQVALPIERFSPALLDELQRDCASSLDVEQNTLIIKHLYIERRMTPLNLYLQQATLTEKEQAITDYGQAIKQLIAANIFPGDMLYKNFGVTRYGRVVFYDYDEIEYLTSCNFREMPEAPYPEADMELEPWYSVGPHDVFPEEFGRFLLGDPNIRKIFFDYHADLLTATFWQQKQRQVEAGVIEDIFPYPNHVRFDAVFQTGSARPLDPRRLAASRQHD